MSASGVLISSRLKGMLETKEEADPSGLKPLVMTKINDLDAGLKACSTKHGASKR
jgi:hypothetical protein